MKQKIILCIVSILGIIVAAKSQDQIKISIPTSEMEADYVWQTIRDIEFFEKNNYHVSLPKGKLIDSLKSKAKSRSLTEKDYENLKVFIQDSIYNKSTYQSGYEKIQNQLPILNQMIEEIAELKLSWDFKQFTPYRINLTLYGPGGSYNPDEGSILIFTTHNGAFKGYSNPANTIIHEIIHIGIEESIISKYKVPHTMKERIVDKFVFLYFNQYLTDYKIQDMGDYRIDKYIKTKKDIERLDKFVEEIIGANK